MATIDLLKTGRATAGGFLGILLLVNVGLTLVALHAVITGEPDTYKNEQMRLLANSLSGIFIVSSMIAQWMTRYARFTPAAGAFLVLAFCTIAWSLLLAR